MQAKRLIQGLTPAHQPAMQAKRLIQGLTPARAQCSTTLCANCTCVSKYAIGTAVSQLVPDIVRVLFQEVACSLKGSITNGVVAVCIVVVITGSASRDKLAATVVAIINQGFGGQPLN